ncbi:MAG: hypothetical protein HQ567_24075 [Candidatus Nealsonbacteria bacterium]|nr:hypothetical protein [Candidatus Nealsonbacteria bacterium]
MAGIDATQRILFMHSAHPTVGVSVGPTAMGNCDLSRFAAVDKSPCLLRACLVSDLPEHEADGPLDVLTRYLGPRYDVVRARVRGTSVGGWSGPDDPRSYDCIVLLAAGSQSGSERLAQIERGYRGGRVVVGHRNGNRPEPDAEFFGDDYGNDYGDDYGGRFGGDYGDRAGSGPVEIVVAEPSKNHRVLAGVGPLVTAGPLGPPPEVPCDAAVLLIAGSRGRSQPVAWIRSDERGRTFHTSLGQPADFHRAAFLRLLANAVDWTSMKT